MTNKKFRAKLKAAANPKEPIPAPVETNATAETSAFATALKNVNKQRR